MSTAAQTRAAGWYWTCKSRRWLVAEWCVDSDGATYWMLPGTEDGCDDSDFAEIDERPIERLPEMPVYRETRG